MYKDCIDQITFTIAMLGRENRGLPVFALTLAMLQREAVETVEGCSFPRDFSLPASTRPYHLSDLL